MCVCMCIIVDKGCTAAWLGRLMLLLVFMYVNKKDQTSDPQPSCSATPRPPAVNGGVVCSPKVEATVALNHAQLLCVFFFYFFVLSFLPLCVFQPSPSPHPKSLLLLPLLHHRRAACSEICTRRSSAPLRTCSWMAKTRASCCRPGVASASRGTFSSECADGRSRRSRLQIRPGCLSRAECFTQSSYQLFSASSPGKKNL